MANADRIKLPDGTYVSLNDARIPALTGNSGKILKTDGTDASWASLNSAIPVLISPVRIWDLEPGVYILPDNCEVFYTGSSDADSIILHSSILSVTSNGTYKRWICWSSNGNDSANDKYCQTGYMNSSSGTYEEFYLRTSSNNGFADLDIYSYTMSNLNLATSAFLANGLCVGTIKSSCTNKPVSLTLNSNTNYVLEVRNSGVPSSYFSSDANIIRQDLYLPTLNKHYYRIVKCYNSTVTPNTSITNADAYGWVEVFETFPALTNNAGKVLAVNSNADGVEWVTPSSGGLTYHDFTHTANTTVSTSTTTVTFAAGQRCTRMLTISADLGLSIACNNVSDNYIWIKNTGSAEVDVTISSVTKNSTSVSSVYMPSDGITVPAGGLCEIGVIVNSDGAFITSRNDLTL